MLLVQAILVDLGFVNHLNRVLFGGLVPLGCAFRKLPGSSEDSPIGTLTQDQRLIGLIEVVALVAAALPGKVLIDNFLNYLIYLISLLNVRAK